MHKLLLSFLLLFTAPLWSQAQMMNQPVGALTFFNEDGERFFLILNGERQNEVAQTNVRIDELPQPYYSARIVFEDKSIPDISKNVAVADADGILADVTYRIKKNGAKRVMRSYSAIPYAQNFAPPPGMFVRHFGGAVAVPGMAAATTTTTVATTNNVTNVNVGMNGLNMNVQITDPVVSQTTTTTTTTSSSSSGGGQVVVPQGCAGSSSMSNSDFAAALATIEETSFDESRLSTAQSIAEANCLSADQIVKICNLLSFEQSKLAFAKSAYGHCTEPRNYFKVNNVFSFDASKKELNSFTTGR